jgi:hypothetical protein
MSRTTANEVKTRWNRDHYVQVKISVNPDIAAAFKSKCQADGVSMASELSRFMSGQTPRPTPLPCATRPLRRKALSVIISQLYVVADAESAYLENIPQNLQNSVRYENAERSVSALNDALDILAEAY